MARLCIQGGDPDSAVNRAYYSMFNIARAALLHSGVPEGELPRTHRGVNEAFREHAVLTGRVESHVANALSRAENLRLMADYTAKEIEPAAAAHLLMHAEAFLEAVGRAFDLDFSMTAAGGQEHAPPTPDPREEQRRQGRENWLRMRGKAPESAKEGGRDRDATLPGEGKGLGRVLDEDE
jgi:uncharacterized protein (UPF0332 family)